MNFGIGLSGLRAAQNAIDIVGTNLSNATTEGYHKQDVDLSAFDMASTTTSLGAGGVVVKDVVRNYDALLERESLRQLPTYGQATQLQSGLSNIESVLGQVSDNEIETGLADFFSSINQLSSDPNSYAYSQEVVRNAQSLSQSLNNASDYLENLKEQILYQANQTTEQVNQKVEYVAELNLQIDVVIAKGGSPNLLLDQRDQAISELAEYADIYTSGLQNGDGQITVQAWGTPVVTNNRSLQLEIQKTDSDKFGVGPVGKNNVSDESRGGTLGGMMELYNTIIPQLEESLDNISQQVMTTVNNIHAQGVGMNGSFERMQGVGVDTLHEFGQWDYPDVQDGNLAIRFTDPDGETLIREIEVLETDKLSDIVSKINALDGDSQIPAGTVVADTLDDSLAINTTNGWKFDFVPGFSSDADDPAVLAGTGGGAEAPEVSFDGIYTGENQKYSFEFSTPGATAAEVGVTENLTLTVKNEANEVIKIVDVGQGYAEGDVIEIEKGFGIKLSAGTVNDAESFSVTARSESDTSGILNALGMNTLFSGTSASDMQVNEAIVDDPSLIAAARGAQGVDSFNAQKILAISEEANSVLGGSTIGDYHRDFVSNIGQMVSTTDAQVDAADIVRKELETQRDAVSGVDPNEEAAKLMIYSKMFQAMGQFMNTQSEALDSLMEML